VTTFRPGAPGHCARGDDTANHDNQTLDHAAILAPLHPAWRGRGAAR
jgi:hypothetical protein